MRKGKQNNNKQQVDELKDNLNLNMISIEKVGKKTLDDYKKFAIRGNLVDLTTGVVLGAAFTNIVNNLVNAIVTPFLGLFTNRVDLSNLYVSLTGGEFGSLQEARQAGALVINYGAFINAVINFLIVSFVLFLFVRYITKIRSKMEEKEKNEKDVTEKDCPYCYSKVPIQATKCAYCTSDLNLAEDGD